jgi:hypothetical protein
VSKIDVYRVLADTTDDSSIPKGKEGFEKRRYSLLLANFGTGVAAVFDLACKYKPEHGEASYNVAGG